MYCKWAARFCVITALLSGVVSCSDQSANNALHNEPAAEMSIATKSDDNPIHDNKHDKNKSENKDESKHKIVHMNQAFYLSPEEIEDLGHKAENGDRESLRWLLAYYSLYVNDEDNWVYWLRIGANKGDPDAQRELGKLIRSDSKYGTKDEGQDWLNKAADAGDLYAKIEIQRKFTEEEIQKLKQEADSGKMNSANILYLYYHDVEKKGGLAQYWFDRWLEIMHKQ